MNPSLLLYSPLERGLGCVILRTLRFLVLEKSVHIGLYVRSVNLLCLIITENADVSSGGRHLFPLVFFSEVHAAFPAIGHCLFPSVCREIYHGKDTE